MGSLRISCAARTCWAKPRHGEISAVHTESVARGLAVQHKHWYQCEYVEIVEERHGD